MEFAAIAALEALGQGIIPLRSWRADLPIHRRGRQRRRIAATYTDPTLPPPTPLALGISRQVDRRMRLKFAKRALGKWRRESHIWQERAA